MATNTPAASKKANLLNPHAIKHLLDESVTEIVISCGYVEDVRLGNIKLLVGIIIIGIALLAQFYPKKFPENKEFLLICIGLGSFNSTGLVVSSKLPRFSDMYTLTIASADPKSISANKPVELSKSVTKWFTEDGVLVEGLLWKDVGKLIDDYNGEKKGK